MKRASDLAALRRLRDATRSVAEGARAGRGPAARSDRAPLLAGRRFRLAVAAILRNEASYIEEWLCHHLAVGVEHFFLYDNGSDDDLDTVIRPYVAHGLVTLTWFPLRGGQRDANNHAVRFFGSLAEWLAWVDLDEFLVPHGDAGVPELLDRLPAADQVLVARREFCFGGHRERPDGLVTERYRLASTDVPRVGGSHVLAKPIVRPERVARMGIHAATTVGGACVDVTGRPVPEARPLVDPVYAPLQVNHYYTRSWAEFEAKRSRASTSTHAFPLPPVPFDIPAEPDESALRWVPRTRAWLARMAELEADPYRYGSHLRLPDFPRNDPFTVQAAAVVANELAALPEPRKQRAMEVSRQPGLRGAAGRAPEPYEPAVGRFSRGIHARQHLAWLRATSAWDLLDAGRTAPRLDGAREVTGPAGEPWVLEATGGERLAIELPVAGRLACHALLLALRVAVPLRARVAVRPVGEGQGADGPPLWTGAGGLAGGPGVVAPLEAVAELRLDEPGTWLAEVACDADPRRLACVRLELEVAGGPAPAPGRGTLRAELYDLALVTFG